MKDISLNRYQILFTYILGKNNYIKMYLLLAFFSFFFFLFTREELEWKMLIS